MMTKRKVPGRKHQVGEVIPIWQQRAAIAALAQVRIDKKWTLNGCVAALQQAEEETAILCKRSNDKRNAFVKLKPEFDADDNTIGRVLKNHIPSNQLTNAIYLWMATSYKSVYDPLEEQERARETEKDVSAIRLLLGHSNELNLAKAKDFAGTYRLFRPSHNDPNDVIMVTKFVIGKDALSAGESDFSCSYESEYVEDGKETATEAVGKIIPHGQRLLAVLTTLGKGNFFILFDRAYRETDASSFQSMGGIMMAAVTDGPASAWPVFAARVDDPRAEFEYSQYDASELTSLPRSVWNRLRRGAIYWADETFPGFGLRDAIAKAANHKG
jgi:hypothetical protein